MKRARLTICLILIAMTAGLLLSERALQAADNKNYPVLLIHGLASDASSWINLPKYLSKRGMDVFVMDFNEWADNPLARKKNKDLHVLAALVSEQIRLIKKVTGKDKVNIIAHSIAGLIVRAYIADMGAKVEKNGRYSNDVNRVIYLSTPHFGFSRSRSSLRRMLKDTDWGPYLDDPSYWLQITDVVSPEEVELHDYFVENGARLGVEQLTVYSQKDTTLRNYQANLDGETVNPLFIPRPNALASIEARSRHVTLRNFEHAYHELLGRQRQTILGVRASSHPLVGIVTSFFTGADQWRSKNVVIKGASASMVLLRVPKNLGAVINFQPNGISLKRVRFSSKKRVQLNWDSDSEVFYFSNEKSGVYELSYAPAGDLAFRFDMNILEGTVQIATFDPRNPPFDPAYEVQPGDMAIAPGDIPAAVKDELSMRRFILAAFPFESRVFKTGKGMAVLARQIRDELHRTYPDLIRKASADKFGLDDRTTVDWVSDFDNEGVLANKLSWTVEVKPEPKPPGADDPGTYPTAPPAAVYDANSLKEFVLWFLRGEAYTASSKDKAGRVRDKLAAMYPSLARVNDMGQRHGYSADWGRHTDAVVLLGATPAQDLIVDFASDVDGRGSFYGKLQWSIITDKSIYPWK